MSWSAWPWYFISKVNSSNRVLQLKNTLCILCLRGWGFHAMPFSRCLNYRAFLGFLSCESECWRRYTCTNVLLVGEGEVGELVQPGGILGLLWRLLYRTSGSKEQNYVLCLVIVVIFMGFGQAGAKRCYGCLKAIIRWWQCKSQQGNFCPRAGRFSLLILLYCETLLKVLLGTYFKTKRFYRIPIFTMLLFYLFEVGKAKIATHSILTILTLNGLFQKKILLYPWKFQTKQRFTPRNST